jgi:hypothetical protein
MLGNNRKNASLCLAVIDNHCLFVFLRLLRKNVYEKKILAPKK